LGARQLVPLAPKQRDSLHYPQLFSETLTPLEVFLRPKGLSPKNAGSFHPINETWRALFRFTLLNETRLASIRSTQQTNRSATSGYPFSGSCAVIANNFLFS
ncbi:MAG: hypothetical protein ACLTCF_04085, partial [Eggerthellaceae bacterium]